MSTKKTKPEKPRPVVSTAPGDARSTETLCRNMIEKAMPAIEGVDLATRAALAALPAVVSHHGAHVPAFHVVKRAVEIGEAFAAQVRVKQGAEGAK